MMRDRFTDEQERARAALWSLDPGCPRDEWVKNGMAAKAAGLDFDDFHQWSAGGGNFQGEAECRSVWRSIKTEGGVSAASLFRAARDAGWEDGTENRAKPLKSRQTEPKQSEPTKPPPYDPRTVWDACEPATAAHEYIARKLGLPDGVRVYSGSLTIAGQACDGALVLPCFTLAGDLASLQFVGDKGKPFLPGVRLPADGCLILGGPIADKPVYLVEGIGQAWSAHQATGCPAVVCFGWGRVAKVAEALRVKYPASRLVIVPDAGKEQQAEAIARHVRASFAEMPEGSQGNYDLNDYHQAYGLSAVAELLQRAKEPLQRFRLLTPAELAHLPPLAWRIRGVLPKSGIAALFGPSGSGKSFLALDMLAAMAEGRDWFGCRVTPCPVLYSALEGEAGISQRVKAHQMKNGRLPDAFRFMLQGLDIRKPADRADLVSAARGCGLSDGVVCIDTLNRAAPGADENDSAAMGEIIAAAKSLQGELGGLVLLIHHTGKDATKGLRGHSSLHAALDAAIAVNREGERREWLTAKAKDGADDQGHPFRLQVVEIDTDEEGEPITSCVVIAEERTGEAIRRALPPKSGNQRIIWDALGDAFRSAGSIAPEGAPKDLPPGRPCLSLEDAIAATRGRLVCDSKRQTERTQAAITGLINRGLLDHREGWLWCA
jgi:hypothetical protein